MCSWCYGISDELAKVEKHYNGVADFEVILGGLRPHNQETMLDLKSFLTHHWEEVNARSGQAFKYDILNSSDITYDTEPPCRAVVTVRKMDSSVCFDFFRMIQREFYFENKNMHDVESYRSSVEKVGLDFTQFKNEFHSLEAKADTELDFRRSTRLGVRSFPTVLLEHEGRIDVVAAGYSDFSTMVRRIDEILDR